MYKSTISATTKKLLTLALLLIAASFIAVQPVFADDCTNIGGTFHAPSGECRINGPAPFVASGGSYSIATPLHIMATGSIVVPSAPGVQTSFALDVAGDFTVEISATGGFAISGNGAPSAPSIGAAISIVAAGNILVKGNGSIVGAQMRANSGVSGCASTSRAGSISLLSTRGHIRLEGGSKLFTTGGCLGGEITVQAPVGNVEIGARLLSQGVVSSSSNAIPVRGGPITVSAAGNLMVTGAGAITSQGSVIGTGTKSNYGADRVHLESGGDMTINGSVQSVGGFTFGPDILGGVNRCTGASRVGKPATPTGCVEVWVGGNFAANGGDPRDPANLNNGYISARSGDQAQANGTCCTWIDIYVTGDVRLKGQPSGVSTNGFMIDAQQSSSNALGGTINMWSLKGKVTASGRTFIADAATAGGTGGTVRIQAAGPTEYPPLPPGQFHPADLASNVDLGDSLQFARGANTGTVGGAGDIFVRSFNGQITGGPVDVLTPGTSVALPAGTVLCPLGIACDLQIPPLPSILATTTTVTLPLTTFVAPAGTGMVRLGTGTRVTLPGGLSSILWRDVVIAPPAGKASDPSLTPLAGACTDRHTGAPIINPSTGSQYVCDEFVGTANAGGIGSTQLVVELCEGWLYNGVTVPLTTTFSPQCGGRPEPPPDVVIPIAPTISIFGGVYLYDGLERPATGDQTNGQFTNGNPRLAVVPPTALGENGASEPLRPLPTVTYVDANGVPVAVPIQIGTYTATALFPGCSPTTTPCGPAGTPQAVKSYTGLVTTAPIIIFSNQALPQVTVLGGVYRFDGLPHPATGVTTTDSGTGAAITAPPTVVYYNCTWTQATPPASAAQLVPGPAAFGPGCTTTPPVNTTTTKVDFPLGNVAAVADGMPVVAYFSGNATYGPAIAKAGIAIWQPRPSVTTATGGTFVYDGNPHATTTTVRDGGTDGLGTTYPTSQGTVDPATWTFLDPNTGATLPSGVTYTGATSPLRAVSVQAPVNVGTYPVLAVYPGDAIHSGSTGTNTIVITPRPATVTVVGGTFLCDDNPHPATGSITSTNASGQTISLDTPTFTYRDSAGNVLAAPPVAPGTYTVTASLPQTLGGNYSAAAVTATITINQRTATVSVTGGGTFVWDGLPHAATGTVTGTGVPAGTQAVITYTRNGVPSGVPTAVGVYTVTATAPPTLGSCFVATPATTTITITPRTAVITVTGGTFFYDAQPHPGIGTLTGTGIPVGALPDISYTLDGLPTGTPVQVGVYTATASLPATYASSHTAAPATATITIRARSCAPPTDGSVITLQYPWPSPVATTAYGVNNAGQIVGGFVDASTIARGFWKSAPSGTYGTPPIEATSLGAVQTTAYGINSAGQIVGMFLDGNYQSHGFLLTGSVNGVGGTFTAIDVPGAAGTVLYGINDSGQIVGASLDAGGNSHGFTLTGITFAAGLPSLAGAIFTQVDATALGAVQTVVYGLNNTGKVVGAYVDAAGKFHGFSLTFASPNISSLAGATLAALNFPGAVETWAHGINDSGDIVGNYVDNADISHGFLLEDGNWSPLDIGECGTEALCINNNGDICGGYQCDQPGDECGFIIPKTPPTPMCEAGTETPVGSLLVQPQPNGNVRVTYVQSLALTDTTYGTGASADWGTKGRIFKALTNSDMAQFSFKNGAGAVVMRFNVDYITASTAHPSGYGTLGVSGGDGGMVTGSASNIAFIETSISANLNQSPEFYGFTVNSPSPLSAFPTWEVRSIYTVEVKAAAFGPSGFGSVTIPMVHNSSPKHGMLDPASPVPCPGSTPPPPPPSSPTTSCVAITAVQGVAITPTTLTGTGGAGGPYTFTATGLPAGLTMSSGGTISGTPTVSGTSAYTVTVKDKNNTAGTLSCSVTVSPPASGGAFTTYTQGGWGAKPAGNNPGKLLSTKFSTVYPGGSVAIGGTKTLTFTSASAIEKFLPQGGTPGTLTASATNPTSSGAGVFAGQVLALRLSVDFSNAGVTRSGLGALRVVSGALAGSTVTQVLALANTVIGGNTAALPAGLTVSGLNAIVDAINNNFDNGTTNNHYLQ